MRPLFVWDAIDPRRRGCAAEMRSRAVSTNSMFRRRGAARRRCGFATTQLATTLGRVILKTGVRISMTSPGITMTIDLQAFRVADAFAENAVLRAERIGGAVGLELAALAWLATGARPRDARLHALAHAVSCVTERLAGYGLWLLACHTAWQPASRLARHRRLWSALKARGLDLPLGRDTAEGFVEGPSGLRFFGALQLLAARIEPVAAILEAEPASHLVALRRDGDTIAASLAARGWGRAVAGPDAAVLTAVCSAEGVVLWPLGSFDDREAGCVALAKPEIIDRMM